MMQNLRLPRPFEQYFNWKNCIIKNNFYLTKLVCIRNRKTMQRIKQSCCRQYTNYCTVHIIILHTHNPIALAGTAANHRVVIHAHISPYSCHSLRPIWWYDPSPLWARLFTLLTCSWCCLVNRVTVNSVWAVTMTRFWGQRLRKFTAYPSDPRRDEGRVC